MRALQEFTTVSCIVRLLAAALLGGMIGLEREKHGRAAGLRTHILVCMGAAMTVIVGLYTAYSLGFSNDPLRTGAQVISGIGFLGAGTILTRGGSHVTGLTTAAGLWTTAAIGLAVGTGYYVVALTATAIVIVAMVLLSRVERGKRRRSATRAYYLEITAPEHVQALADRMADACAIQIVPANSGAPGSVGVRLSFLREEPAAQEEALLTELRKDPHVAFLIPVQRGGEPEQS